MEYNNKFQSHTGGHYILNGRNETLYIQYADLLAN